MNPGFYKLHEGLLFYGPNCVLHANYELYAETHKNHDYPVDGWYWFDSEDEAYEFFGLPRPEISNIE